MADKERDPKQPDPAQHLRNAAEHLRQAVQCYAAALAGTLRAWGQKTARQIAWILTIAGLGLIGALFVLSGLANLIQSKLFLNIPGMGHLCVGAGLLVIGLALLLLRREDKGE